MDDRINIVAFQEKGGLAIVARKPIQNEPIIPVMFFEPTANDLFDNVIGHQFALGDDAFDMGSQLGM